MVNKQEAFAKLQADYKACTLCPLSTLRSRVVFGTGNIDAKLLMLGEAPGKVEDEGGEPFIGPAGEKFNRLLEAVGLKRADIWITNVCLCRPKSDKPGKENRAPLADEIRACSSRLSREISIVRPQVIVVSGNTPLYLLTGKRGITSKRGWLDVKFEGDGFSVEKIYATLHPASLLYGSTEQLKQKRQWIYDDWLNIAEAVLGKKEKERERREISKST